MMNNKTIYIQDAAGAAAAADLVLSPGIQALEYSAIFHHQRPASKARTGQAARVGVTATLRGK